MSVDLELDIAKLVLDTELTPDVAKRLGPVIGRAVERLAERLATRPRADLHALSQRELGAIELAPEQLDRLLGPGGAEQLADLLLRSLLDGAGAR